MHTVAHTRYHENIYTMSYKLDFEQKQICICLSSKWSVPPFEITCILSHTRHMTKTDVLFHTVSRKHIYYLIYTWFRAGADLYLARTHDALVHTHNIGISRKYHLNTYTISYTLGFENICTLHLALRQIFIWRGHMMTSTHAYYRDVS